MSQADAVLIRPTDPAPVAGVDGAAALASAAAAAGGPRSIWGLDALQVHTRYWAAHGVQVVRQGEPSEIVRHAELYLLTDPRSLTLFRLTPLMNVLNWVKPQVLFVRLRDRRERGYRERVITDADGRFRRFQRLYDAFDSRLARVVLTPDRHIAQLWQSAPDPLAAWRRLRKFIPRIDRVTLSSDGNTYDRSDDREVAQFLHDLVQSWRRPDTTIGRAQKLEGGVWKDPLTQVDVNAKFVGPVWIGAGRHVDGGTTIVGPAVIWDDPQARPAPEALQWLMIEPPAPLPEFSALPLPTTREPPHYPAARPRAGTGPDRLDRAFKRGFDVVFAALAICLTLPLYPLIMLAIWLEDGRPFFFAHRRETRGGREFPCIKFRSMRKDAEQTKTQLAPRNQADGPQFFIDDDPRLTRVGRILRDCQLDELPQFFNVLAGHMSVVGPRPSPFSENQYCPPWREARLSVRPGITGLWQVMRTRRPGADFQEWIKYDLEYVQKRNAWMDLAIVLRTALLLIRRLTRS